MAVRLIFPLLIASSSTGATLAGSVSETFSSPTVLGTLHYVLIWVCRVDNDGVLRFVIDNKIGIVVAAPRPWWQRVLTYSLPRIADN